IHLSLLWISLLHRFLWQIRHEHFFSSAQTAEPLSWIAESLKYFCINIHPDALRHPSRDKKNMK
ncbi:MAG: hypothetical protein PHN79_11615, partial [Methanoregula sp.]|nr:hypothetical protein [Methanoregula sp.]